VRKIAEEFGVSPSTVQAISRHRRKDGRRMKRQERN
jgi:transposase